MEIAFIKCQGSGNDFPLIDARAMTLRDEEWATIARLLSDRAGSVGGDGLLLLVGENGVGQRMYNVDGSEAETCLNGVRCVARLGFELMGISAGTVSLKSSVAEAALVAELAPGVVTVRTEVGPVSTRTSDVGLMIDTAEMIDARIDGLPSERRFSGIAMPNPHLVAFVEAIDEDELVAIGEWCEAGPALVPARANVSFVTVGDEGLYVRTFERGVGLTDSCGSAMGASIFAAGLTGRVPFGTMVRVRNRGGMVRAGASSPGDGARVTIEGNATFEYEAVVEVDLVGGTVGEVVVMRIREDEVAAWERAIKVK